MKFNLISLETADSTNEEAKRLIAAGAGEGTAVLSKRQTAGRGRGAHVWESPIGGVFLSVIVDYPALSPELITITAGVAAARVLHAEIKWVNDIILNGKKLCGILAESYAGMAVVGFGVNVNNEVFDGKIATSLLIERGKSFSEREIAEKIAEEFFGIYKSPFSGILKEYKGLCLTLNKRVSFTQNGEILSGIAVDLDERANLLVETQKGITRLFAGEVSVKI
ncbi:biotin--[acetyl-CoA-carboxylase] ligase [Clostridia bacterium]|nr:biotin--[acetyl-CoA-carboxylase] ligase [Clostridia bacterium]